MPNLGACTQGSFAAVMRFSAYSSVIRRCLAAPHDSRESTSKPTVKLWSAKGLPLGRQFRTVRDSFPSYGSSHIHIRGHRNSTSFEHDLHLFFSQYLRTQVKNASPLPTQGGSCERRATRSWSIDFQKGRQHQVARRSRGHSIQNDSLVLNFIANEYKGRSNRKNDLSILNE